jgi:hypothetical protein
VDEHIIMVGIVTCTLELGNQRLASMDVMNKSGPRYQHKKPCLMSVAGREIVRPRYAATHVYGET